MGENSQPNPESDNIFKKSLSICLKKSGFEKSLSPGLKKFSLKESLCLEKFGGKKVWVLASKIFGLRKVSVSV